MSLIQYGFGETGSKLKKYKDIGTITNHFPLIPNVAPPTDYPLDPHNDLLPPGYASPYSDMKGGPPEMMRKRYFSLTVDDIHHFQKKRMKKWIKVYEKVLGICFRRIRDHVLHDKNFCFFEIPTIIPGFPVINITHCMAFMIRKLNLAGFKTTLIQSNIVAIFWDVPDPKEQPFQKKVEIPSKIRNDRPIEKDVHYINLNSNRQIEETNHKNQNENNHNTNANYYGQQREEPFLFT
jgi:hypothetical protein